MLAADSPEVRLSKIQVMGGTEQILLAFRLSFARDQETRLQRELPDAWHAYSSPWQAFGALSNLAGSAYERDLVAYSVKVGSRVTGVALAQKKPTPDQSLLRGNPDGTRLTWWYRRNYPSPSKAHEIGARVVNNLIHGAIEAFGSCQTLWSVTLPTDTLRPPVLEDAGFIKAEEPTIYPLGDRLGDQIPRQLWVHPATR